MKKKIIIDHYLDLRGLVCPINFVKCCLALETLSLNQVLKVDLDLGEAEISVIEGLKEKGYKVDILKKDSQMVSLMITSE
ncbi:sulfurtransferase TusA family protein [Prochlorococcus marinus]|uniref:Sulfurtransferase TusA family protein n=1 Tax=Prochlorococcus marinus XMU1408 TaxID=2213228 RepID=A0A318R1I5_PROMR|nr:sulfurtransferase TusA family protein [Prochlorococcus marinus]MBW3042580.1 sulfurtransferase TusA family protein [Prochlorococcus marinus str. XMU1408]PYE03626.1 sulfurtransferase TusA family protein [Prochlorococcus marinus XMU1408]